ncbi:MAG: hypothetical protein ACYCU5_09700 [Actinomycetes bacterium]
MDPERLALDVHDRLDEVCALIEGARAMPMSASVLVNRADVLQLLEELRDALPEEVRHAELVLSDRDAVIEEGRAEAERLVVDAREEQQRLVASTEILARARIQAEDLLAEARREAARMRRDVDGYVDTKLGNFEIVLDRTLAAVQRGREKLAARQEAAVSADPLDDRPLPDHG